jgi:hypothetical protein
MVAAVGSKGILSPDTETRTLSEEGSEEEKKPLS